MRYKFTIEQKTEIEAARQKKEKQTEKRLQVLSMRADGLKPDEIAISASIIKAK